MNISQQYAAQVERLDNLLAFKPVSDIIREKLPWLITQTAKRIEKLESAIKAEG